MTVLLPVFALSIFVSAALLFMVQPLAGRILLPLLGGSPAVWNTCMLFFQVLLLGGYAYAHATSRLLRPRTQAVLHVVLLLAALATLPRSCCAYYRLTRATRRRRLRCGACAPRAKLAVTTRRAH